LLGRYDNFPETVHGVASFNFQDPVKNIQQAVFCALHRLNHNVHDLGAVTPYSTQKCEVSFEFGVAEGDAFNFLDENELEQCLRDVEEKEFQMLDFFFVVRYHITRENGERVPLRFDYHVLRFSFQEYCLEIRVRHEKGSRRVQLDDLTYFLVKQINAELSRRRMNSLVLVRFEKVGLQ
jgi:hypothetical protein